VKVFKYLFTNISVVLQLKHPIHLKALLTILVFLMAYSVTKLQFNIGNALDKCLFR